MRTIIPINYNWLYKANFEERDLTENIREELFEKIELPHTNVMLPYNNFDENSYQFISCYVKKIFIAEEYRQKKIFLDFEGVMLMAEVYCNGVKVGEHKGGYTKFAVELTQHIHFGEENKIVVKVDSTERPDIPPFGKVVDYLTFGGIYREVSLRIVENTYIDRVQLRSKDCLSEQKGLEADVWIYADKEEKAQVVIDLQEDGAKLSSKLENVQLLQGMQKITVELDGLKNIKLWDIDNPYLYDVKVSLINGNDEIETRFGFREAAFKTDGFYLNGKPLKLIGLNRHQAYPYVGYAMPERVQKKDADILKYEAGTNIVRTSHYPQSRHFLDRCDEIGLLVMEEIPGWQHVGDREWQKEVIHNVKEMIATDSNHPSIILWGVRVNESFDFHDFYEEANRVAREMDPSRQTGGVRYIQGSEFLEDVYTYNDFSHDGGSVVFRGQQDTTKLEYKVPMLVTESNGHMYPTKKFDHEEKLVEHAARHLRVINEAIGREDLCGGISWCAFDYNTHSSFGSGDKICYHGVYDMFRLPKYAAFSYVSQKSPEEKIVLEPISIGCCGERNGDGMVPITVLTNCDYIKVYKNGSFVADFYPEKEMYPHLEHPPIIISYLLEANADLGIEAEDLAKFKHHISTKVKNNDLAVLGKDELNFMKEMEVKYKKEASEIMDIVVQISGGWGDVERTLTIEGYYKGKKVAVKELGEHVYMNEIRVTPDSDTLVCNGDTYDATRIVVEALNNLGRIMPFTQECVSVSIEGPLEIMGPSVFPLIGGNSAFWVKTTGEVGRATIKVQGVYYSAEIELKIREC